MMENTRTAIDLPKNWVQTEIGEIAELIRGVTYAKADASKEPKEGYVPILRANNIDTELNFDDLVFVPQKRVREEQFIRKSDVIVAMSSGSKSLVGKTAQAKNDFDGGFGAFCGLVRAFSGFDRRFLGLFFQGPKYRNEISRLSMGVNINNLRRDHIESMVVNFPPLPEQHRIVAKIEELFTKLDAGVEALNKVKAQLKCYRQAVLKHAFEGKLTAEWREKHKHELEPASVLLERIKEERKKNTKGKYKEPPPIDTTDLPELPEGWEWTRLGYLNANESNSVTDGPFGSNLKTSHYTSIGPRVIRLQNIGNGVFVDEEAHISNEHYNQLIKHSVCSRDLVIASLGDSPPRSCIVPQWLGPAIVKADCIKFKPNNDVVMTEYLNYALNSSIIRKQSARYLHGVGRPRLGLTGIRLVTIPLPSIEEQYKVVDSIERHFSIADEIEKVVELGIKQSDKLRQSILKKAFDGKLVPQDPSDEPAEKLLERIKEERAKQKTNSKPARSKKKNS